MNLPAGAVQIPQDTEQGGKQDQCQPIVVIGRGVQTEIVDLQISSVLEINGKAEKFRIVFQRKIDVFVNSRAKVKRVRGDAGIVC